MAISYEFLFLNDIPLPFKLFCDPLHAFVEHGSHLFLQGLNSCALDLSANHAENGQLFIYPFRLLNFLHQIILVKHLNLFFEFF